MAYSMDTLTLDRDAGAPRIIKAVRKSGVAVLPAWLGASEVAVLNREFDAFVAEAAVNPRPGTSDGEEGLTIPVVRNTLDPAARPATAELFAQPAMREIADAYFEGAGIGLNHQIYVNLNRGVGVRPDVLPFVPHFDKIPTLKFFFYLTDTTARNGAMGADPGSIAANRRVREEALARQGHTRDIANVKSDAEMIPLEGAAGTLLVFHTDVTHGAGWVAPGLERRVMRGHTRTLAVLKAHRLDHQAA